LVYDWILVQFNHIQNHFDVLVEKILKLYTNYIHKTLTIHTSYMPVNLALLISVFTIEEEEDILSHYESDIG
jgi:hypothetical protein